MPRISGPGQHGQNFGRAWQRLTVLAYQAFEFGRPDGQDVLKLADLGGGIGDADGPQYLQGNRAVGPAGHRLDEPRHCQPVQLLECDLVQAPADSTGIGQRVVDIPEHK